MARQDNLLAEKSKKEQDSRKEVFARLNAPVHVTTNQFDEHHRVEGYYEDKSTPEFDGCDRLLKWDTVYGAVQMGYDPRKGKDFIFANIKTSIYDTAASQHQKKMNDQQRMAQQKAGVNRAFSSKRKENSSVMLYKMQNKPWSPVSIRPYLRRHSMETLGKTLPFLTPEIEVAAREKLAAQDKALSQKESVAGQKPEELQGIRARRVQLAAELAETGSIVWRKQAGARRFFRRLNLTFDLQKQAMFHYYRNIKVGRGAEADNLATDAPDEDDNE